MKMKPRVVVFVVVVVNDADLLETLLGDDAKIIALYCIAANYFFLHTRIQGENDDRTDRVQHNLPKCHTLLWLYCDGVML